MRIPVGGGTELDALAAASNKMISSLDSLMLALSEKGKALEVANEEVNLANAGLEARVEERTVELAMANKKLGREIADKNDFLRTISHDLGAPLRNILGMVDSIMRRHNDDLSDQVRDRLNRVRRNAQTEMELIGELLELSRIRTRRHEMAEADVGEIVRGVADSLAGDLEEKSVDLVIADDWPAIRCEKARIGQVFQNLIDNAVKYMGDRADGRVEGVARIGFMSTRSPAGGAFTWT